VPASPPTKIHPHPLASGPTLGPDDAQRHADYLAGSHAFNRRDFFEAHERWEIVWRITEGPVRELFRGLVLLATGLHKLQDEHRNLNGARLLLFDAAAAFDPLPRWLLGIKVSRLRRATRRCYKYTVALWEEQSDETFPPELFPEVEIPS
jgi:hypothetical protein